MNNVQHFIDFLQVSHQLSVLHPRADSFMSFDWWLGLTKAANGSFYWDVGGKEYLGGGLEAKDGGCGILDSEGALKVADCSKSRNTDNITLRTILCEQGKILPLVCIFTSKFRSLLPQ